MKKLFSAIVLLVLAVFSFTGCSGDTSGTVSEKPGKIHQPVVSANNRFAWDVFKQLNNEDTGENIFISPLSISSALSMTYQGARGSTRDAMAQALNYEGIDTEILNESYKNLLRYLNRVDNQVTLDINNSIWIREGEKVEQEFIRVNNEVFDAAVEELDFSQAEAAERINRWIDNSTKGKITQMIKPPIPANVVMYLINAIYFKGEWSEQFDKKLTFNTSFHAGTGEIRDVMMMSKKGPVEYGQGNDFKVVRLPYGSGKTAMYLVLPAGEASVNDFINGMDADKWQAIKASISKQDDVLLQVPRFKMEYGIKKLNDSLSALGMAEAFNENADFSGIRPGIFISRVLHKAVIEVNEAGSEAAGATVVDMTEAAAVNPVTFIADRPFMFVIEETETGTLLFMGKLYR